MNGRWCWMVFRTKTSPSRDSWRCLMMQWFRANRVQACRSILSTCCICIWLTGNLDHHHHTNVCYLSAMIAQHWEYWLKAKTTTAQIICQIMGCTLGKRHASFQASLSISSSAYDGGTCSWKETAEAGEKWWKGGRITMKRKRSHVIYICKARCMTCTSSQTTCVFYQYNHPGSVPKFIYRNIERLLKLVGGIEYAVLCFLATRTTSSYRIVWYIF